MKVDRRNFNWLIGEWAFSVEYDTPVPPPSNSSQSSSIEITAKNCHLLQEELRPTAFLDCKVDAK